MFVYLLKLYVSATCKVCLGDRPPPTIKRAATLREKLQHKLNCYLSQSQSIDAGPASPSTNAKRLVGTSRSAKFEVTRLTRPEKAARPPGGRLTARPPKRCTVYDSNFKMLNRRWHVKFQEVDTNHCTDFDEKDLQKLRRASLQIEVFLTLSPLFSNSSFLPNDLMFHKTPRNCFRFAVCSL